MEYKRISSSAQAIEGRTVTGLCAIFGNIDLGGDRILPGAFARSLQERKTRIAHLWQHDIDNPPTAVILEIREVTRNDVPADVLDEYPETLGGLLVTRRYLDTPRAEEILQGIKSRAITGMSFGYDIPKGGSTYEKVGTQTVRNLREIKLIEVSDTILPMNPATRAAKRVQVSTDALLARLELAKREVERLTSP